MAGRGVEGHDRQGGEHLRRAAQHAQPRQPDLDPDRLAGCLLYTSSERFIVETSARHLHVTEEDLETLFGKGAKLHYKKELSQPEMCIRDS